jgi:hypothetical protein
LKRVKTGLIRYLYLCKVPFLAIIVQSAIAGILGFLAGSIIGQQTRRTVRASLILITLSLPINCPSTFEYYRTSPSDPLGGIIWAILSVLHYLIPIAICMAMIAFHYHQGCKRRLDRQARECGKIS